MGRGNNSCHPACVALLVTACHWQAGSAFSAPRFRPVSRVARFGSRRTTVLASTEAGEEKKVYIKNQRNDLQKKKNFLRGASVFKDVKGMVDDDMKQQFSSDLVGEMQDSPNYVLEQDGFEFHLAKDFGFCWGVERSINLAYSAVETFPDSKLHITNELIHNPQVNGHLK